MGLSNSSMMFIGVRHNLKQTKGVKLGDLAMLIFLKLVYLLVLPRLHAISIA
jgi:hypothetical protein